MLASGRPSQGSCELPASSQGYRAAEQLPIGFISIQSTQPASTSRSTAGSLPVVSCPHDCYHPPRFPEESSRESNPHWDTLDEGMAEAEWEARKLSAQEPDLEPGPVLADSH